MKYRYLGVIAGVALGNSLALAGELSFSLNGRPVTLPLDTPVVIDEMPATLAQLQQYPDGMQASWSSAATIEGGLPAPVFSYTLIGPVTGNDPLEVLGQAITATADTVLVNAAVPLQAPLGTTFVVAGLVDTNGSVLATLVERRGGAGNSFLLTGPVTAVDTGAGTLDVGAQTVAYAGVQFNNCPSTPPPVGSVLSLRAPAVANFPPGSVLGNLQRADCIELVPPGTAGAAGFIQGLVGAVANGSFELGGLTVVTDGNTSYQFGTVDDLAEGVAVSVDGSYVDAQQFAAAVVEFVRPVVRFEAPMTPAQVTPGESLRPFGVSVLATAQLRDEDGIVANGLNTPTQVEVRGYLDSSGQAHATRVRERGNPDPADVRLRGPVQAVAEPLLQIQGLLVDSTGATFSDELGNPLSATEFFALVAVDHLVDVSGASWDEPSHTLSGGALIWIGAEPLRPDVPAGLTQIQSGTVTGYALADELLADGFE